MQTPLWQFWTDWAIKAIAAFGTFLVAFIALFGSWLRNWIWPPELTISLVSDEGHPLTVWTFDTTTGKQIHQTSGFWYFVRVENSTRWNPVTDVYIFLLAVEQENAAGELTPVWSGRQALHWRQDDSLQPKKIGYSSESDLCHILENPSQVKLGLLVANQMSPEIFTDKFRIAVTLQARGVEADSKPLRIKISWDGKWSADKDEMKKLHLVFNRV
jgi:hypothetical protein